MKKILFVCVLFLFVFSVLGCETDDEQSLNIIVPAGSPSLAQTYFQHERPELDGVEYNVDVVSGPEPLGAAFGSESHDIIFAPTNLGAHLINSGDVPYKFAAAVTWGNFYLVSGEPLDTMEDLDGKDITAFGRNSTPDIILQSPLNEYDFEEEPVIQYVSSVQVALGELKADSEKIVLLAEPVLSVGQMDMDNLQILDLQDEWEKYTGKSSYPQAGIFVKDSLSTDLVEAYLALIEESVQMAIDDPALIAEYAETLDYGFPRPVLENAIPRSHIRYSSAEEAREDLEFFFERILELNPDLIRNHLPDDEFYFAPSE